MLIRLEMLDQAISGRVLPGAGVGFTLLDRVGFYLLPQTIVEITKTKI